MKLLNIEDFECVGDIAQSCDLGKLCIAEEQAITFDMAELFCDMWDEIYHIWLEVIAYENAAEPKPEPPENYETKRQLIYGGHYETCASKKVWFVGFNRMLAFYTYARYSRVNRYNDTPNGLVGKTGDNSQPIDNSSVKSLADQYNSMGYATYKKAKSFLCFTQVIDFNDCGVCGCGSDNCKGKTTNSGYKPMFTNIVKSL